MNALNCTKRKIEAVEAVYHPQCVREAAHLRQHYAEVAAVAKDINDEYDRNQAAAILVMFSRQAYNHSYLPK